MLEGHPDSGPGSAGRAAAHGVHHHQHGAVSGLEKAVDIGRRASLLDAVLSKIRPHGGDKVLGVCHGLILTAGQPLVSFLTRKLLSGILSPVLGVSVLTFGRFPGVCCPVSSYS